MKRILLTIWLLLFWVSTSLAANVATWNGVADSSIATLNGIASGSIGTWDGITWNDGDAACGDLAAERTDGTDNTAVGDANPYRSSAFTTTGAGDIHTVYVSARSVGVPDGNLYLWLCPSTGTAPASGTAMGDCVQSTTTDVGDIGDSYISVKYAFAGYTVADATIYHMVFHYTGTIDATNYFRFQYNASVTNPGGLDWSADGTSWTSLDTSAQANQTITSCVE